MGERVALVTGASRGIGRAIALRLAAGGVTVYLGYRQNRAAAEEVARLAGEAGGRGIPCQADLEDPAAVQAMFDQVRAGHGVLDVFVADGGLTLVSGPVTL